MVISFGHISEIGDANMEIPHYHIAAFIVLIGVQELLCEDNLVTRNLSDGPSKTEVGPGTSLPHIEPKLQDQDSGDFNRDVVLSRKKRQYGYGGYGGYDGYYGRRRYPYSLPIFFGFGGGIGPAFGRGFGGRGFGGRGFGGRGFGGRGGGFGGRGGGFGGGHGGVGGGHGGGRG